MVRVKITLDERWPVFSLVQIESHEPSPFEATDSFYEDYLQIMSNYHTLQKKLKDLYDSETHDSERESCPDSVGQSLQPSELCGSKIVRPNFRGV